MSNEPIISKNPEEIITFEELHNRILKKAWVKYRGNYKQITSTIGRSEKWVYTRVKNLNLRP